ncbi:FAD-dependent monooxygenase [Lachnellula subtilissima]|uniref:FAD-dependent monooxygenase n=1 Tax=Lachnellula subtilissima TaxID=602034 RepID=A0A8H8RWS2_9HELO|nr:FAD-dependent monooxygenase [Lachnellula subtilissima]
MGNFTGEPQTSIAGLPVIIIGSGRAIYAKQAVVGRCTGLAIAHGLKKAGIPVILFEKKPALRFPGERDWNMGLHWGMPILKSLIPESAVQALHSTQVDPNTPTKRFDTLKFVNGKTGKVITRLPSPDFHRLRRSKLRALLCKGLDIRWNKRLKDIVFEHDGSRVTAVFEDGEQITGRLIIGADGSRSTVRELILSPDLAAPLRLPYVSTFVQAKYTREQALFLRSFHPLYIAAIHPDNMFAFFGLQDAPAVDKPEDWTFFFYISWNSPIEEQLKEAKTYDNKERLAQVKFLSKGFTEPWKSAFEWVADDQPAWYFDMAVWDPSLPEHTWDTMNGRVTLAGDAAHPMTFRKSRVSCVRLFSRSNTLQERGQGLNHSITDAGKLVQALTSAPNQSSAIQTYELEMTNRAGAEVRCSIANTTMLHDWNRVLESPLMKTGLQQNK